MTPERHNPPHRDDPRIVAQLRVVQRDLLKLFRRGSCPHFLRRHLQAARRQFAIVDQGNLLSVNLSL